MTEDEARALFAGRVSRETMDRLDLYADLLTRWQRKINLVSRATLDSTWTRHFLDSAQLLDVVDRAEGVWLDLGSGAGFPGLVCAILAGEERPSLSFELVESDHRKAAFLREVARQCGMDISIFAQRIEQLEPRAAHIISARALAPLQQLLTYAYRHLAPGGLCLFPKGVTHREELEQARSCWHMTVDTLPSVVAPGSVLLRIGDLRRAG